MNPKSVSLYTQVYRNLVIPQLYFVLSLKLSLDEIVLRLYWVSCFDENTYTGVFENWKNNDFFLFWPYLKMYTN